MGYKILRGLFQFFFRITCSGMADFSKYKKIIITPNHVSILDGLLIALFFPIKPTFAIYSNMKDRWYIRFLGSYFNLVFIDSSHSISIKTLIKEVNKESPIVIFPEGRITTTGSLMKIYDGAAFIALKTQAKIIPVRIDGAEFSLFSYLKGMIKRRIFPQISLHFGPAQDIVVSEHIVKNSERRKLAGEELEKIMINSRFFTRKKMTLIQAFLTAMHDYGRCKKIIDDVNFNPESYQVFFRKIIAINQLMKSFSQPNEKIGVLLPNTTITAATIFASSLANRIPALLNYTSGIDGISNAVHVAEIKTIITSRLFLDKARLTALPLSIQSVNWIYLEELKDQLTWQDKIKIIFASYFPAKILAQQDPNDDALILFTSGSEGLPKGVVHSHYSLLSNVEQLRSVIDVSSKDHFLSGLPLFHAFGITAGLLLPIVSGCRIFFYPNPLHYRVIPELVYDLRCTVLFSTPTFLNHYAHLADNYDFSSIRYVVVGAEKLNESTRELWFDKFGIRILEGYGVTELAPVVCLNTPKANQRNSVGRLLPGIEARVIPVKGISQGGRLQLKGPNMMKGYLRAERPGVLVMPCAENEKGIVEDNWHDTGDLVMIDKAGFMSIVGRVKRFAKIAGEMVSLESIEKFVKTSYPHYDHAVVAIDDDRKGEQLILFTTAKMLTHEKLMEAATQAGLATLLIPRKINIIDNLPLLGTGKIDFVMLNQLAMQE